MWRLIAAALLAPAVSAAPDWDFIGTTDSALRIFVDNAATRDVGGLRRVTVRVGSPRAFVGSIVEVVQTEELDCARGRWRLLGFDARDAAGAVVQHHPDPVPPMTLVPIARGTIAAAVRDAVCGAAR